MAMKIDFGELCRDCVSRFDCIPRSTLNIEKCSRYEADYILKRIKLEATDDRQICHGCGRAVLRHLYGTGCEPREVRYCPFCGEEVKWKGGDEKKDGTEN